MISDKKLCQWLRENSSGNYRNSETAAIRIEQLLEELEDYKSSYITSDGESVVPGDRVWVLSSMGEIKPTRVSKGCTGYTLYNSPVPVKDSFSSKEKAQEYLIEVRR
jgi:hypothetical protein